VDDCEVWEKCRSGVVGDPGGEVVLELGGLEVSLVCLVRREREGNGEIK